MKQQFLKKHKLLKSNQDEIDNMNIPRTIKEIGFILKISSSKKSAYPNGVTSKFYQTIKEELILIPHSFFYKLEGRTQFWGKYLPIKYLIHMCLQNL